MSVLFYIWLKIPSANNVDPDQMLHYMYMMSDLGLHCCLWPFYGSSGMNGLRYFNAFKNVMIKPEKKVYE